MVSVPVHTTPTFSFGAGRILFPARNYVSFTQRREYDVTADGNRFLMIGFPISPVSDKLIVVTNWFEELKNKRQ